MDSSCNNAKKRYIIKKKIIVVIIAVPLSKFGLEMIVDIVMLARKKMIASEIAFGGFG